MAPRTRKRQERKDRQEQGFPADLFEIKCASLGLIITWNVILLRDVIRRVIRTVRTNWGGIEINATGPAFSFLGVLSGLGVSLFRQQGEDFIKLALMQRRPGLACCEEHLLCPERRIIGKDQLSQDADFFAQVNVRGALPREPFMSNFDLSVRFFLQLTFILAICRLVGLVARKLMQPQVVAEMIAGVLMGPSLLGLMLPEVHQWLFPKASMTIIYAVSQVGLVLYMFLVGVEFQIDLLRQRFRSAAAVSVAGIVTPFTLGCLLALSLIRGAEYFAEGVSTGERVLFFGAAMSITAFPVLARIIDERGITGTPLGTLALAAGSMDDAAAWCILAVVLATFNANATIALYAVGGGALYVLVVLSVGKRLLRSLGMMAERKGGVSGALLAFTLMLVMLAAWFTDAIGIYSVFGAFIIGTAMPRGIFTRDLQRFLEPLTTNFLLPLFFVYSGLNTRIGLVNTPFLWIITLLILLAACSGKGVACWLAARFHGETQRDARAIGTLMNARGLMELILLNIGLEHGIITPTLFTIMVLMAIVTTLMASPLFELVYRPTPASVAVAGQPAAPDGI